MSNTDLYINLSSEDKIRNWTKIYNEVREAGWTSEESHSTFRFGGDTDNTVTIHITEEKDIPTITDGYEILTALGATAIEEQLAASVPAGITVDKVLIGYNWILIRAGKLCGVARSPQRGTAGGRTVRPQGGFAGVTLSELAQHIKSSDPLRRSLGLAAINTFWNRPDGNWADRLDVGGFRSITPPGAGTIIIGGFRGVHNRLPEAKIVEREPRPGDIPASESKEHIQNAKHLAITAQTFMNGSFELLKRISSTVPNRMILGPSAPLCPIFLDAGFQQISGAAVIDADAAETFVAESGTMIMLDHIVKPIYLGRNWQE